MNRNDNADWERIWGNPRYGDWDLDDMEAFLPPEDWEGLSEDMTEALTTYRDGAMSVPWSVLKPINDRLRDQGIEPKAWWAELYGRCFPGDGSRMCCDEGSERFAELAQE